MLLEKIADYAIREQTGALRPEVIHHAKRAVIDWYAALLPGSVVTPATLLEQACAEDLDRGHARLASGRRATLRAAALINGAASHSVEFDDIYRDAGYHPGSPTISAALAAVSGSQDAVVEMLNEYRNRRDNIHQWLTVNPAIKCVKPSGAFYLFPDISGLLSPDGLKTSAEFAQALLEKEFVVVTPGEGFDAPGYLRISYATSMDQIREGTTRILRFAESLQPARAAASR